MRAARRGVIGVMGALALAAVDVRTTHAQSPAGPPVERVSIGIASSADTVTVGDPFSIGVRVRAPLGSTIEFPQGPDSTAAAAPQRRWCRPPFFPACFLPCLPWPWP